MADGSALYSLIPLNDFKAILGVDDREDASSERWPVGRLGE
jgi:hypothetical protein